MKLLIFLIIGLMSLLFLYNWHNTGLNLNYTQNIHSCIYESLYKKTILIDDFEINYVAVSPASCINPNFPSIHISCKKNCNAWIHVVHTDAISPDGGNNWTFIDASTDLFPFYTLSKDFYDAPYWNYTLYKKPLTYWKGHAYAVQLDENKKVASVFDGIEWGFRLSALSINPQAIIPRKLTQQEQDWDFDFLMA